MNKKTFSPVVKNADREAETIKLLSFPVALLEVIDGKKITKLEWADRKSYVFLKEGFLLIHKSQEKDTEHHSLLVSEADLIGTDWFVL